MLVVDDHPMWRQTLCQVAEHTGVAVVVAEAATGDEAVQLARSCTPQVVLMDMDLPGLHGVEATRAIVGHDPAVRVLVLSSSADPAQVLAAMRAGAHGYLLKTVTPTELADGVRRVVGGELVLPAGLSDVVREELRSPSTLRQDRPVRVAVAADRVLDGEGLLRLLAAAGHQVVGRPARPAGVVQLVAEHRPEVVVLDAAAASQHRALAALHAEHPDVGVVVLAEALDPASAQAMLDDPRSTAGYLLKRSVQDLQQLADTVRRVADGELVVDPEVVLELLTRRRAVTPLDDLSPRERDVMALMAEGRSNQAIGERLFVGPKTVEAHVASIFSKLGLEPTRDDHRRVLAVLTHLRGTS